MVFNEARNVLRTKRELWLTQKVDEKPQPEFDPAHYTFRLYVVPQRIGLVLVVDSAMDQFVCDTVVSAHEIPSTGQDVLSQVL